MRPESFTSFSDFNWQQAASRNLTNLSGMIVDASEANKQADHQIFVIDSNRNLNR